MKYLYVLLVLLFASSLYSQVGITQTLGFTSSDTIGVTTTPDSVEMRIGDGVWKLLTQSVDDTAYVTSDDKAAGTTKTFILANEDYWTAGNSLQFRIYNTTVDTITSNRIGVSGLQGALTLFIRPVVSGSNTVYTKSTLEGN